MYGRLVKRLGKRARGGLEEQEEGARLATEQLTKQDCSRETKEREKKRGEREGRASGCCAAVTAARQQLFY